jgi:hypothetical protein
MRKKWLDDKLGGDEDELVIAKEEFGDDEWCSTPGPIMPMRCSPNYRVRTGGGGVTKLAGGTGKDVWQVGIGLEWDERERERERERGVSRERTRRDMISGAHFSR